MKNNYHKTLSPNLSSEFPLFLFFISISFKFYIQN
nr:MAG TPA: hypothetical protein [Caudoviricetes sp.]